LWWNWVNAQVRRTSGLWYSAEYSTFSISDEAGDYQLTVTGYSGDAGDAMAAAPNPSYRANGMMFSTPDSDNDGCACSCAADYGRGWWFGGCSASTLNVDTVGLWTAEASVVEDVDTSRLLVRVN